MRGREKHAQQGAFTPAMGIAFIAMAIVALGSISLGRLVTIRADCQRAADAAALAAAANIRNNGWPFTPELRQSAELMGQKNSALPVTFSWTITETDTAVEVDVRANIRAEMPSLVFVSGSADVSARARTSVKHAKFDEVNRKYPKLAMVLDYSGSMNLAFSGGGGGSAIDVLEQSVRSLLAANLRIDYGAVFYSSNVFATVAVGPGAPGQINNIMNNYGAGGNTNTAAGLNTSRNVLAAAEDTGRYVLLVSDGEPCCASNSFSAARAAADNVWGLGATIFTLEIRRSGSSSALSQFMTDVAGKPDSRGDPNYHFVATSAADLLNTFQDSVARILCTAGPLDPAPTDPSLLHVFLRAGDDERPLDPSSNLAEDRALERYQYDPATMKVQLTEAACDAVLDRGDDLVVRFDQPAIIE
jgi:hypothetical protein